MDKKFIEECWSKLDKKLSKTAVKSFDKLPYTTVNGEHNNKAETNVGWWTNGFWAALMMVMYMGTKKEQYINTSRNSMKLLDEALMWYDKLDHDVGFMWNISSGVDYRLTGNAEQRNRFLIAANHLVGRFNLNGGFLRAWNGDKKGWAIIDCMMNLPLLYRATQEVDDERFAMIANCHADKTMKYHVRPDGSVNHINEYHPLTGEFIKAHAGQGCAEDSSWSRGQAWGLYGFALAYRYTKNKAYLDTSKKIAHYFITCASRTNWLTQCDFRQSIDKELYDTTAGACAACGLLELAKHVPDAEKSLYEDAAYNLVMALEKECDWTENEDSILQRGTEAYGRGEHMPMIYGDYFFVEAIYRMMGYDDSLLW